MNNFLAPRSVVPHSESATDFNYVESDFNSTSAFKFSHGLTGTDQNGNWFSLEVMGIIFAVLIFIIVLRRILLLLSSFLRHVLTTGMANQQIWSTNMVPVYSRLKQHLLDAPLWNRRHNEEFHLGSQISLGTLPTRSHTLLLALYITYNVLFCLTLPWKQEEGPAIVAALRGRSGHLAAFNLILTVLFVMRNNPLIRLLNISYDTFVLFHRWAARLAIAEAITHTLCWLYNTLAAGQWAGVRESLAGSTSFRVALAAMCFFFFILIQSWSPIRRPFYDAFVTLHRIAVYVALICVFYHLWFHGLPQLPFFYTIGGILIYEYIARIWGILYYNISTWGGKHTKITIEALPANVSRVTICLARPWTPKPGSTVHIYIPALALWISHPFSIAWYNNSAQKTHPCFSSTETTFAKSEETIASKSTFVPTQPPQADLEMNQQRAKEGEDSHNPVKILTLLVHARKGMTLCLYNRAKWFTGTPSSPHYTTFGMIEAPYAWSSRELHHSFDSYGTILLFAGGIGITGVLHQVHEIISRAKGEKNSAKKVVLVWSIPRAEALVWVDGLMEEVLSLVHSVGGLEFEMRVFVSNGSGGGNDRAVPGWIHDSVAGVRYGRCNVDTVVDDVFGKRVGAMIVDVCGPGRLADGVRSAVRKKMGMGSIDFVEEGFSY